MPSTGPNLGMVKGWANREPNWGASMNLNLDRMDAIIQLAVISQSVATPPGSPTNGDRYIVAASPTGAWTGHAKEVAVYESTAWVFYAPKTGWSAFVAAEAAFYYYTGSAWAVAMNPNLRKLNAIAQLVVQSRIVSTPPGSPADGVCYIVPAGASGAWTGQTNNVAVWEASPAAAWIFYTPLVGWIAYSVADGQFYYFTGTTWANPLP